MAAQHFFVGRNFLGTRQIPTNRVVPGLEIRPHFSYCLFCMRCGDIWARIMHDAATLTQIRCVPCRKHGDGRLACHPQWLDDPTRFEEDWPSAAIRHEFLATLAVVEERDSCASPGVTFA